MSATRTIDVPAEASGQRLDHFAATQLEGVSRSRVQMLIDQGDVLVDGQPHKASLKLRGGEHITITGEPHPAPLKAVPEAIPLDVVYEDADLAVVNKPAGMMVHAGSGATDDARSRGTLVNALLHRFQALSSTGGELRPGIVHRLDKETSGLIVVAKNDRAHAALGAMFAGRRVDKTYIALVHGAVAREKGTISAAVSRDQVRRTRMTTRPNENARSAISHYQVLRRLTRASANSPWSACALRLVARTRSACTWRLSAILWWATRSTAAPRSCATSGRSRQRLRARHGKNQSRKPSVWAVTSCTRPNSNSRIRSPASRSSWKRRCPRS